MSYEVAWDAGEYDEVWEEHDHEPPEVEPEPIEVKCLGCGRWFELGDDLFEHFHTEELWV